jgi:hypothetical protein
LKAGERGSFHESLEVLLMDDDDEKRADEAEAAIGEGFLGIFVCTV